MSKVRIFVTFDLEHDGDLYDRLVAQSATRSDSGFEVSGRSEPLTMEDPWREAMRTRIGGVDQLIVICGEHTDASRGVSAELRIAQEERTPYFLLWGRRGSMCTRPAAARPGEGMYSWTPEILQNQIIVTRRIGREAASAPKGDDAVREG
jgi:hypothetical protein